MANIRRVHPGVYIKENLIAMKMTAKEFSARTGISERTLSSIINGIGDITFDVAYKLSLYFENSINYWSDLQIQYNMYKLETKIEADLEEEWNLIKNIKKFLIELGCITESDSKKDAVFKCRNLVGVNSLILLNKKDSFVCFKEQYTQNDVDYFLQNFWIALALNKARKKNVKPYNKKVLIDSIPIIKRLTTQDPVIFFPKLQEIFNSCGVSFIFLPYLAKSNIYGVTKWFNKENVMLAISNRSGRADLFWFTLFHEISHVLMEHRRENLISSEGVLDDEADQMAQNMLISEADWHSFINASCFTISSINQFANEIGILPAIVLGRLHKEKKVPYGKLDKEFNVCYNLKND